MTPTRPKLILFLVAICVKIQGASISGNLKPAEIERLTEVVGLASTSRLLRSAEPYKLWPGIRFGIEVLAVPTKDLNSLGDAKGNVAQLTFLPRIVLSKGLFYNLELGVNFLPVNGGEGLSTFGLGLKWTTVSEEQAPFAIAPFLTYTKVSGLGGFRSANYEFGGVLSRDLVSFKPYLGLGLIYARGSVPAALANGTITSAKESTIHIFGGAEFELPLNVTVQLDFMNVAFSGTLFIGKKF